MITHGEHGKNLDKVSCAAQQSDDFMRPVKGSFSGVLVVVFSVIAVLDALLLVALIGGVKLPFVEVKEDTLAESILGSGAETISASQTDAHDYSGIGVMLDDSGLYYKVENGEAILVGYSGDERKLIIPKNMGGYPVTGSLRFMHSILGLYEVQLPESMTVIPEDMFSGCYALRTVIIPEGVAKIADRSFHNCPRLEEITIPSSVSYIGNNTFEDCTVYAPYPADHYGYEPGEDVTWVVQ